MGSVYPASSSRWTGLKIHCTVRVQALPWPVLSSADLFGHVKLSPLCAILIDFLVTPAWTCVGSESFTIRDGIHRGKTNLSSTSSNAHQWPTLKYVRHDSGTFAVQNREIPRPIYRTVTRKQRGLGNKILAIESYTSKGTKPRIAHINSWTSKGTRLRSGLHICRSVLIHLLVGILLVRWKEHVWQGLQIKFVLPALTEVESLRSMSASTWRSFWNFLLPSITFRMSSSREGGGGVGRMVNLLKKWSHFCG